MRVSTEYFINKKAKIKFLKILRHLSSFRLKRLWISFFVSSPLTSSRSARQIRHPDPARRIPNSRPNPWAPPVMIALFPLTSNIFNIFRTIYWSAKIIQNFFFSECQSLSICLLGVVKYRIIYHFNVFYFCVFIFVTCFSSFYFISFLVFYSIHSLSFSCYVRSRVT